VALKPLRQPDLRHPSNDFALATVFAIALAIPFGLGILLLGNVPTASQTTDVNSTSHKSFVSQRPAARIAKPVSLATFTPVPVIEVANEQAPEPIAITAPTASAISTATSNSQPTLVPFSTPLPAIGRVTQTGGDGVYLRHQPVLTDRWIAWPDNTPLVLLDELIDPNGTRWLQVRDPKNNIGWVPAQYVAE
jgi:hypothetical protein